MIKQNKNTPGSVNGTKHGKYNKRERKNENRGQLRWKILKFSFQVTIEIQKRANGGTSEFREEGGAGERGRDRNKKKGKS